MKETASGFLVALGLALVVGAALTVWLIGAETLRIIGLIFIGGVVVAGVLVAAALPIRAWRKNDAAPIERQVIRETRIIDNRPQPLPALPLPQQAPFGVFPELLRAAYLAGGAVNRGETVETEVRQLGAGDGWNGDITG